jgi:ferritin-like protein
MAGGSGLPQEVFDVGEFLRLSERAEECRVKRSGDVVKLKLRTPGRLYTIKLAVERAEEVLRALKCPIREV